MLCCDHRNKDWQSYRAVQPPCSFSLSLVRERLCYRSPVTSMEWVGRPSFVITKEYLEVIRSYGLSWVEIAKALAEPKINFIIKKCSRGVFFSFCHAPFFENRCVLFSFNSYFKKVFGHRYGCFILATG